MPGKYFSLGTSVAGCEVNAIEHGSFGSAGVVSYMCEAAC